MLLRAERYLGHEEAASEGMAETVESVRWAGHASSRARSAMLENARSCVAILLDRLVLAPGSLFMPPFIGGQRSFVFPCSSLSHTPPPKRRKKRQSSWRRGLGVALGKACTDGDKPPHRLLHPRHYLPAHVSISTSFAALYIHPATSSTLNPDNTVSCRIQLRSRDAQQPETGTTYPAITPLHVAALLTGLRTSRHAAPDVPK